MILKRIAFVLALFALLIGSVWADGLRVQRLLALPFKGFTLTRGGRTEEIRPALCYDRFADLPRKAPRDPRSYGRIVGDSPHVTTTLTTGKVLELSLDEAIRYDPVLKRGPYLILTGDDKFSRRVRFQDRIGDKDVDVPCAIHLSLAEGVESATVAGAERGMLTGGADDKFEPPTKDEWAQLAATDDPQKALWKKRLAAVEPAARPWTEKADIPRFRNFGQEDKWLDALEYFVGRNWEYGRKGTSEEVVPTDDEIVKALHEAGRMADRAQALYRAGGGSFEVWMVTLDTQAMVYRVYDRRGMPLAAVKDLSVLQDPSTFEPTFLRMGLSREEHGESGPAKVVAIPWNMSEADARAVETSLRLARHAYGTLDAAIDLAVIPKAEGVRGRDYYFEPSVRLLRRFGKPVSNGRTLTAEAQIGDRYGKEPLVFEADAADGATLQAALDAFSEEGKRPYKNLGQRLARTAVRLHGQGRSFDGIQVQIGSFRFIEIQPAGARGDLR